MRLMPLTRRFHLLTALLLLIAGAVTAQEAAPLSDEQIRQLIEQKLQAKKLLKDSFDVTVETGVVTLTGKVPNIWTKERILAIVLDVP